MTQPNRIQTSNVPGVAIGDRAPVPEPAPLPYLNALGAGSYFDANGNLFIGADPAPSGFGATGPNATAFGVGALGLVTDGGNNTAVGQLAASATADGGNNTAIGQGALEANVHGNSNTALGQGALNSCTGSGNTAVGKNANVNLAAVNYTTAIGFGTAATALGAVAIGVDHTGAGASTATQDEIKLGTALHTVNIPTTSAIGNGASGSLTALAKGTGGGPASDAVNAWIPIRNGATSGWIPFFV